MAPAPAPKTTVAVAVAVATAIFPPQKRIPAAGENPQMPTSK